MFKTHLTKTWIVIELDLQKLFYAIFMQILQCKEWSLVSFIMVKLYVGWQATLSYNFNAEAGSSKACCASN